jgi:hypothetical protein
MTIKRAVQVGTLAINVPVFIIIISTPFLLALTKWPWLALPGFFIIGFPLAWLYWSVAVPKWKMWAYPRVDNVAELKKSAIRASLIWPDGSVFNKTEIKTKKWREREKFYGRFANTGSITEKPELPSHLQGFKLGPFLIGLFGALLTLFTIQVVFDSSSFAKPFISGGLLVGLFFCSYGVTGSVKTALILPVTAFVSKLIGDLLAN